MRYIALVVLMTLSLQARDLYVLMDKKTKFNETNIVSQYVEKSIKDKRYAKIVVLAYNRNYEYNSSEETKNINLRANEKKYDLNALLSIVLSRVKPSSDVIIGSTMDYVYNNKDSSYKIDFKDKRYNYAWITSSFSPIKHFYIDKYQKDKLKDVNMLIIDSSKDMRYLANREDFFRLLLHNFGANLISYGSLHNSQDYLFNSFANPVKKSIRKPDLNNKLKIDNDYVEYHLF